MKDEGGGRNVHRSSLGAWLGLWALLTISCYGLACLSRRESVLFNCSVGNPTETKCARYVRPTLLPLEMRAGVG